jgi:hypothetical protein
LIATVVGKDVLHFLIEMLLNSASYIEGGIEAGKRAVEGAVHVILGLSIFVTFVVPRRDLAVLVGNEARFEELLYVSGCELRVVLHYFDALL